jgi:amidophosphoribosyltransferase
MNMSVNSIAPHKDETPVISAELNEKCGVLGILSPKVMSMGHLLFFGLYALQHRGQESCGMAVFTAAKTLLLHKELGLVSQVFTNEEKLASYQGVIGVGHTRYATAGSATLENAQPVVCHSTTGDMVLAHNGNLFNLEALRDTFNLEHGDSFGADSDSHVMARCIAQALRKNRGKLPQSTKAVLDQCEGAFSLVLANSVCLIAARDRHGIRPLCVGQLPEGQWVIASETCALDIIGASFIRNIDPGEIFVMNLDGSTQSLFLEGVKQEHFCIFEYVYFARPDSQLHGQTVYPVRMSMGKALAHRYPVEADYVIPVPDSGSPAAVGYSQASGIPYVEGLIKNRYVGRTFIHPSQELRERGLRLKLNPLTSLLAGKRVVVVDDSIVRGTTSRRLVQLLRECGVAEVHLRISSAPVKHPCFYGIDMSNEAELLADKMDAHAISRWLGADSLGYLTTEDMQSAVGDIGAAPCMACFTNHYPAGRPELDSSRADGLITC